MTKHMDFLHLYMCDFEYEPELSGSCVDPESLEPVVSKSFFSFSVLWLIIFEIICWCLFVCFLVSSCIDTCLQ